ncbi:MAG: phage terminase large subunit [Xanthobacteraceae bacterium]
MYGSSDFAVTEGDGDWTVHMVVGIDPDWHIYLLDLWRAQTTPDKWIEAFCDLVEQWKPIGWAQETGHPFLERRMRERRVYVARAQFPTRGDKAIRAQSIRGRMLDGLYVPTKEPWYPALRSELLSFPAGKHDDMVDALGLIGQILDRMNAGTKPKQPPPIRGLTELTLQELFDAQPRRTSDQRI